MNEYSSLLLHSIELARQSADHGQLPFSALLAQEGRVVIEAGNTSIADNDVTRHSVMNLISRAHQILSQHELEQCTLFTNSEPCAMCSGAIYWAGISKVVFGCSGKTLQQLSGQSIDIDCHEIFKCCHPTIDVVGPIEEERASELIMEFWPHPS
ncbi:nucleoside deaminase [Endozoicomonas sp. GU-1]|uniref:nucleoside deaminase n=1 Tax=Endozoicomonas sp. GU-1 TaxID=3009078 RepID=UPI0022B47D7D|nr:nucleoside deaminase [Endozoicomonas sp. GU-1]WBA81833.1 nucleoside deaminase [Endozoicomonas sp. GU-1]WBA84788.1 nucleoside deaminase [Endozoicomonas sp. GU-1]